MGSQAPTENNPCVSRLSGGTRIYIPMYIPVSYIYAQVQAKCIVYLYVSLENVLEEKD